MVQSLPISIIVPVYNGKDFLDQCLQSLLDQTFQNFEILIVDDCSTDNSSKIIKYYANRDERIKVIQHPINRGLPAALNSGIEVSRGEFQTWISHDNYIGEEYLGLMLEEITRTQSDIVFSDYWEVDTIGEIMTLRITENASFLPCGNVIGASFIYRTKVAASLNGYNEEYGTFEDYDFWIRALNYPFKFTHCSVMPYFYRIHAGQLTNTKRLPNVFFQYKYGLLSKIPKSESFLLARALVSLLKLSWKNCKCVMIFKIIIIILLRHPIKVIKYSKTKVFTRGRLKI